MADQQGSPVGPEGEATLACMLNAFDQAAARIYHRVLAIEPNPRRWTTDNPDISELAQEAMGHAAELIQLGVRRPIKVLPEHILASLKGLAIRDPKVPSRTPAGASVRPASAGGGSAPAVPASAENGGVPAGIQAALGSLGRTLAERGPEPLQLPIWPDAAPGMPNPLIRSALFPAIKSKDRQWLKREKIATVDGVEIIYSGQQWNQQDFDVALAVFNLARNHPLGDVCHTSAHGLLKALGWGTGKEQHVQLHETVVRLMNPFEVKTRRYSFGRSLISAFDREEATRRYKIRVDPQVATLFLDGDWTQIDSATRRQLRGKDLALWLQAHYASHHEPYPYGVELLRKLSGGRTKELKHFRANLRQALDDLRTAGAIAAWEIDGADCVRVRKGLSFAQQPPEAVRQIARQTAAALKGEARR